MIFGIFSASYPLPLLPHGPSPLHFIDVQSPLDRHFVDFSLWTSTIQYHVLWNHSSTFLRTNFVLLWDISIFWSKDEESESHTIIRSTEFMQRVTWPSKKPVTDPEYLCFCPGGSTRLWNIPDRDLSLTEATDDPRRYFDLFQDPAEQNRYSRATGIPYREVKALS